LRSIDQHCGADYRRLRLGIGHPGDKTRMIGHVLGNFSSEDRAWLDPVLDAVAEFAPLLLSSDEALFATRATARLKPPAKPLPSQAGQS
jgi:PTH1 family peptidyl-tRNA hydrolase